MRFYVALSGYMDFIENGHGFPSDIIDSMKVYIDYCDLGVEFS